MPQSLSKLLVHLVFSTKHRERVIHPDLQSELHAYLTGILKNTDCVPLQIGGTDDHVHVLFALSRKCSVAEIVEKVKVASSKWIKTKGDRYAGFRWQSGYGAFSVSQSDADTVVAYIRDQEQHHAKMSFQEEYRRLLDRYAVPYDERYVWD